MLRSKVLSFDSDFLVFYWHWFQQSFVGVVESTIPEGLENCRRLTAFGPFEWTDLRSVRAKSVFRFHVENDFGARESWRFSNLNSSWEMHQILGIEESRITNSNLAKSFFISLSQLFLQAVTMTIWSTDHHHSKRKAPKDLQNDLTHNENITQQ